MSPPGVKTGGEQEFEVFVGERILEEYAFDKVNTPLPLR